jgi:hypothetical protein
MKIWLDDIRQAPEGYIWCKRVNEAISVMSNDVTELHLDHDLGDYANDGGDAICLLDWCIEHEIFPNVILHTANPVGRANMQRLLNSRNWKR